MSIIYILVPATIVAAIVERPKRRKDCQRRINSRVVW